MVEAHTRGRTGTGYDNRFVINAVLYRLRTGCAGRDLPERFGPWHTGAALPPRGAGRRVAGVVGGRAGARRRLGAGGRDHGQSPPRRGRAKKSAPAAEAVGRWRGGVGPKGPAVVDALGNGLLLTAGQQADRAPLPAWLRALAEGPGAGVSEKAYDTSQVLETMAAHGAEPVLAPKANWLAQRLYDKHLHAERNKVERFFGRLQEARGFATCCEKTAPSFLAVAHLLAALDWLRQRSTPSLPRRGTSASR